MKITFLEAAVPLTKTFSLENGEIVKVGHPKIVDYTSHQYEVSHADLAPFHEKLLHHASLGHCLLKGNVTRALVAESRAGTTDPNEPTWFLCLDLDGLKSIASVREFMALMGLQDVDCIVQFSSSMGVLPGRGLSAHVFVLLDKPALPSVLKQWLVARNFAVPALRSGISLTRTGNALRWTLDVSTCQSDKLIYIAPPLLGDGVVDKFTGERIELVRQGKPYAQLDLAVSAEANRLLQQRTTDSLREAGGLEKKRWDRQKTVEGVTYMPKPDAAFVTGVRDDGKYVHLNLNGGDSWAYWHYAENPKFLYNFKGEPTYLLSEIVPEYWAGLRREVRAERAPADREFFIFRGFDDSTYYNAVYDPRLEDLKIAPAKGEQQVRDWLTEHGQPQPEVIDTWDREYLPHEPWRFSRKEKRINLYQPSELELRYRREPEKVEALPDVCRRVMLHALGGDERCLELFVNWLAVVMQLKKVTQTAWVLHGIEGTGKGLIFNEWLRPMLGEAAIETRMTSYVGQFNGFLENRILVFVDEGEMEAHAAAKVLAGDFRNYITEPRVQIRQMRTTARTVLNFANFIIASNKGAVLLTDADRRYNVAPYQAKAIAKPEPAEMEAIRSAAWPLYCYLMGFKADKQLAKLALVNEAKSALAALNRNSIEETCRALKEGNYQFFVEAIASSTEGLSSKEQDIAVAYKGLVERMKAHDKISREEIFLLMSWIVGGISPAPAKFTKLLAHNRIEVKNVYIDKKQVRGIEVTWQK